MIEAGILAIWNFAPVRLKVRSNIFVHNEDLYGSLASLSCKLASRFQTPGGRLMEEIQMGSPLL